MQKRTASTASYILWVKQAAHVPVKQAVLMLVMVCGTFADTLLHVAFICLFLKLECRAVMIFFHYCVLSNYFWLFIEGLYLFTLLVETFFPEKRYFYWYIIIGWGEMSYMPCCRCIHISKCHVVYLVMLVSGTPTVCVTIWAVLRLHFDDIGWVMNNTVSRVSCFCCICAEHFILSSALLAAGTWMTMLPSGGW